MSNITLSPTPHHPGKGLDLLGMLLSFTCIVHCLSLPFLFALLPTVHAVWAEQEWVHWVLVILATPVAVLALWKGHTYHSNTVTFYLAVPGITALFAALFIHDPHWAETALTTLGACLMVGAHILNFSLVQKRQFDASRA